MKTKAPFAILRMMLILVVLAALMAGFWACSLADAETVAQGAYEIRMLGKADEALTLLSEHASANPDDAPVQYELARTYSYMATGDMAQMENYFNNAKTAIEKAVALAPDNLSYRFFDGRVTFVLSYMALQTDYENAKTHIALVVAAFEKVLEVDPNCGEAMLHLVELNGGLPPEIWSDTAKAEAYTIKLEELDPVLGGKARAIMLPDDADLIAFWKEIVEKNPGNAGALEALGKTYLREGQDDGIAHIEQAFALDAGLSESIMDVARYFTFKARSDTTQTKAAIAAGDAMIEKYLATEPPVPLKAYALGLQARFKYFVGEKEEGEAVQNEAETMDPHFSRASAVPFADLFVPPGEAAHSHRYLFQPF